MDIVVASSRGFDVAQQLFRRHQDPENLWLHAVPRGTYEQLADEVPDILTSLGASISQHHHIYLLAGHCDLSR